MKTFNEFVLHACRSYYLDFPTAKNIILRKLRKVRLSSIAIVCYINWADNELLTEKQIANYFGITQQGVQDYIQRLCKIWPHLPKRPQKYIKHRPLSTSNEMAHLQESADGTLKKLKVWGVYNFTDTDEEDVECRDKESSEG